MVVLGGGAVSYERGTPVVHRACHMAEIGNLLPSNQRQRRTCYALCHILYPVSAAFASFFWMDSISSSSHQPCEVGQIKAWSLRHFSAGRSELASL